MANGFQITGDVELFKKFTRRDLLKANMQRAIRRATIKNSLLIIREVGRKIRDKKYEDNAPLTLALSKGSTALLKEKNLLDAMSFQLQNSFVSEVGFIKNKQSTGGVTGRTIEMQKLVELMHTGYIITVTPDMVQAIMAALRTRTTRKGNLTGKARKALKAIESTKGGGGRRTFRVPPRKFMEEVMTDPGLKRQIVENWRQALEQMWKAQGAKGGEHTDK